MKRSRRTSFKDICKHAKAECASRLQDRVRTANSVAKLATSARDQAIAYRVKDAALNHGICTGLLKPRSDEAGRGHLLTIGNHAGRVHMPIHRLSALSRQHITIKAVLGESTKRAA